jgi:hypothetical protein
MGYINTYDPKTGAVGMGTDNRGDSNYYNGKWDPYARQTAESKVRAYHAQQQRARDASNASARWYASDEYKAREREAQRLAAKYAPPSREVSASRRQAWASSEFGRLGLPPAPDKGSWAWKNGEWVPY